MKEATVTKVGMWASIACIIHCTILPLVAPLLPIFGFTAHNEWMEVIFWITSGSVTLCHAWNGRTVIRSYFALVVVTGTIGLLVDNHELLHAGFYGVAVGAVYALLSKKKSTHDY